MRCSFINKIIDEKGNFRRKKRGRCQSLAASFYDYSRTFKSYFVTDCLPSPLVLKVHVRTSLVYQLGRFVPIWPNLTRIDPNRANLTRAF